jgi:Tfp pilus assembly protein PilW
MKTSTLIILAMLSPVLLGIVKQFYGDMKTNYKRRAEAEQVEESLRRRATNER